MPPPALCHFYLGGHFLDGRLYLHFSLPASNLGGWRVCTDAAQGLPGRIFPAPHCLPLPGRACSCLPAPATCTCTSASPACCILCLHLTWILSCLGACLCLLPFSLQECCLLSGAFLEFLLLFHLPGILPLHLSSSCVGLPVSTRFLGFTFLGSSCSPLPACLPLWVQVSPACLPALCLLEVCWDCSWDSWVLCTSH